MHEKFSKIEEEILLYPATIVSYVCSLVVGDGSGPLKWHALQFVTLSAWISVLSPSLVSCYHNLHYIKSRICFKIWTKLKDFAVLTSHHNI